MAADANLYSAEAVLAALAKATDRPMAALDEPSAISALLRGVREALDVHAVVLYVPGDGNHYTASVQDVAGSRVMRVPGEISIDLATYIRAAQRVVTSEDPVFQIGHLRM